MKKMNKEIKNTVITILNEDRPYMTNEQIIKMYEQIKENNYINYEQSGLYTLFDYVYSELGYEYGLNNLLLNNNINGTSDLIDVYIAELTKV